MLKIRKSYSLGKLRRNILYITKGDTYFFTAAGKPKDMFFHIFDSITMGVRDAIFYNIYVDDLPIAYLCISKSTKQIFFYVDIPYRTRATLTEMFSFVRSKIGSEFYTGTKKTNKRFIEFANKNKWVVVQTTKDSIIFKGTIS